jgi:hypothetical protein
MSAMEFPSEGAVSNLDLETLVRISLILVRGN